MKLNLQRSLSLLLSSIVAAWIVGCASTAAAQEARKEETLTNGSILELQKMNLGDGVIVEKIRASKCDFDVTIDGLKQLKEAKVSDAVMQAMIAAKSPAPMALPPPQHLCARPASAVDQVWKTSSTWPC
jgi:hypothetical protein